jgi:hypothetical protein
MDFFKKSPQLPSAEIQPEEKIEILDNKSDASNTKIIAFFLFVSNFKKKKKYI